MEQYLPEILGTVALAFLVWIARETHANGRELVAIKTRLFGTEREDDGGLAGEVKLVRERSHDMANAVHEHGLKIERLEDRVTHLECDDE